MERKRPVIIAGNWKMYKTIGESVDFVQKLLPLVAQAKSKVYLAVPFTSLEAVAEVSKGSNVVIGAQNMHDAVEGAFTGEIAARMLLDAGAHFVILGHSERRRYFQESDAFINKKVLRALKDGLQPLLCVGENREERERGETDTVLTRQLKEGLAGVESAAATSLVIAYEPVWAIGSSQVADLTTIREAHTHLRNELTALFGEETSQKISILYGGSVTPDNGSELMTESTIDGLLVGGASLSPDAFSRIVNYQTTSLPE